MKESMFLEQGKIATKAIKLNTYNLNENSDFF